MSLTPNAAAKMPDGPQRETLAKTALEATPPSADAEEWRYSPIGDLDLDAYTPRLKNPSNEAIEAAEAVEAVPLEGASAVIQILDGWVTGVTIDPGAEAAGLSISVADWDDRSQELADTNSLDRLHAAFNPGRLVISVSRGAQVEEPVLLHTHHSGGGVVAFPDIQVVVEADAKLSVIERQTSADGPGLTMSRVELRVASAGRLDHSTIQAVGPQHWHLARHTTSVGDQASLTSAIAAFGGSYARLRTDADLVGRGASGELLAVYFGDNEQIHDFRTFQHHSARDTTSNLVFKGTLDDQSGSIYTGMVKIHPTGAGSVANQSNRNVKLSDDAWAWSVPNLEIENSDVRCSHASTVSPVDAEQRFYLHARGVPPVEADKLITAGFFDEVIQRFPTELRDEIREHVSNKLGHGSSRKLEHGSSSSSESTAAAS